MARSGIPSRRVFIGGALATLVAASPPVLAYAERVKKVGLMPQ